jgi:glycogen debranching enzyme
MSVEIKVGPPVLTINRGSTFMVTELNGEIDQMGDEGLFAEDTRFISTYNLYINDKSWTRVTSAAVTYYAALLNLTNPRVLTPDGLAWIEENTIALTLQRTLDGSLHEHFHIINYSQVDVDFMLELAMRSDFADLFDVKSKRLTRRRNIATVWDERRRELITSYHHDDFRRRVVYRVNECGCEPTYANGRLVFEVSLKAMEEWEADCEAFLLSGNRQPPRSVSSRPRSRPHVIPPNASSMDLERFEREWVMSCTDLRTPNNSVRSAYLQSIEDLGSLRLPEHDQSKDVWLPAAGVPWFVALFGRDSLITSYQSMGTNAPFARGALRELANYQSKERDDWRDAQPGKILHELRRGELAHFRELPYTPYYGTADATILYLIVLHEYYRWTGDRQLLEELIGVAEGCLSWIDSYGDLDGDGFQEWKTFSKNGYENMCWKDSGDGVVYRDGRQAVSPKGTCELQGYVYDAKIRMAEIYEVLGDKNKAETLRAEAAALQKHFEEVFWMEDEGTYAFGLDADKKQIDAVTSNPGHCLWTTIVSPQRARRVADRLFEPDMWCGWGIRTLSSKNPAYNPYSYQRGSVWPHDNGIIAAGLKRYGLHDYVNQVAEGIFAAASYFDSFRLPEVFAGIERRPATFPSQYLGANIPQAWAAGSVLHLLRCIVGLRPDAANRVLYVEPHLPDWLPELEFGHIQIGKSVLDLRFWLDDSGTHFHVKSQQGQHIDVIREGPEIPTPEVTGPSDIQRPHRAARSRPRRVTPSGGAPAS